VESTALTIDVQKAADLIRSWNHFRTVIETPPFTGRAADWRTTSLPPLPDYISISRITNESDALYYHSALLITFDAHAKTHNEAKRSRTSNGYLPDLTEHDSTAECVIYTPHGISPEALAPVENAVPALKTLCFVHGLHDVSISWGQQLNLGVHNGLQAQRMLNAKYWVGTHDEVKKGGGLVGWFLHRKVLSVEDALKEEETRLAQGSEREPNVSVKDASFREIRNGESMVLD
jgi:hypothetical protein